jgi:hypothetical protein
LISVIFFNAFPTILQWSSVLAILMLVGLLAFRSRLRNTTAILGWVAIGIAGDWLIPEGRQEGVRITCYAFNLFVALISIRSTLMPMSREHAYQANRRFINAIFGARAASMFSGSIERMRQREIKAAQRGITVLDVMKEEHKNNSA